MPMRNVLLTDGHERLVEELIKAGRYKSISEVVGEALRLFEARERRETDRLYNLRQAAQLGIAGHDEGHPGAVDAANASLAAHGLDDGAEARLRRAGF